MNERVMRHACRNINLAVAVYIEQLKGQNCIQDIVAPLYLYPK